jgi:hypothetical protein
LPWAALRELAYAFTVFIYGRKWDKFLLLPRASSPPKEIAAIITRTRTSAEPEVSISPYALGFRRVLSAGNPFQCLHYVGLAFPLVA